MIYYFIYNQFIISGQTDRFIPGFEKLLAILNRFQDSLLRNLQVPNQMNQSNHLISSSANGIRTESHNHDRDQIGRDQIGCDSPQIGFSKPPSSSIMGGLLNDHYLMDQKQNSFRNQPGTEIILVERILSQANGPRLSVISLRVVHGAHTCSGNYG